jgi:hypothetical protein
MILEKRLGAICARLAFGYYQTPADPMPILYSIFGLSMPDVWSLRSQPAPTSSKRNTSNMMNEVAPRRGCERRNVGCDVVEGNYEPPTRMLFTGM